MHRAQQLRGLVSVGHLDSHENMRDLRVGITVVELGDAAFSEQGAEFAEASGTLWDRDGEYRLALLAELGSLGDETQAIEIHIGSGSQRDEGLVANVPCFSIGFDARNRESPRRLQD